eukprot:350318-Chlamydomonas_euryale.AAC.13
MPAAAAGGPCTTAGGACSGSAWLRLAWCCERWGWHCAAAERRFCAGAAAARKRSRQHGEAAGAPCSGQAHQSPDSRASPAGRPSACAPTFHAMHMRMVG